MSQPLVSQVSAITSLTEVLYVHYMYLFPTGTTEHLSLCIPIHEVVGPGEVMMSAKVNWLLFPAWALYH